jgi:hypothetical protein
MPHPSLRLLFMLFGTSAMQLCGADAVVEYSKLAETRLPYNQRIAIHGTVSDFKDLSSLMVVKSVAVSYSACKTGSFDTDVPASDVTGDSWTVLAGPFEEGERLCFKFTISGTITQAEAEKAADSLLKSQTYLQQVTAFFDRAGDQPADVVDALAHSLVDRLTPEIVAALPTKLKAETQKSFAGSLAGGFYRNLPAIANLRTRLKDFEDAGVPGITAATNASQARQEISSLAESDYAALFPGVADVAARQRLIDGTKQSAALFASDYDKVVKVLTTVILRDSIGVSAQQISSAEVKYLEKYAAVDVAALWVPRINELRGFALLNVYWGPVELTPPSSKQVDQGKREWLRERTSLVLGFSLKNISSSHASKIRGNNVWVYGLGFRINRYVRVSAGSAIYRGPAQDSGLRNDFFVGPSIDLTAIEYFKTIFARIK